MSVFGSSSLSARVTRSPLAERNVQNPYLPVIFKHMSNERDNDGRLRDLLEQRQRGEFVNLEEGDRRTREMVAGKLRERLEAPVDEWEPVETADDFTLEAREYGEAMEQQTEHIDRETLQRFLSDIARIGARYGIELEPDIRTGSVRIKPITENQGGYYAERVDAGCRILSSYGSGIMWDDPTDDVVGDDMHPQARAERARAWREENAEAIAQMNERHLMMQLRGPTDV